MNALYDIRWTIDLPEEKLEALIGRPADDSDEWYEAATRAGEEYIRDNLMDAIERYGHRYEPEVEFSA